jgi:hypothetical protein
MESKYTHRGYKSMRHIAACDKLPQLELFYCEKAIDRFSVKSPGRKLGHAISGSGREDSSTLIAATDEALYRAKRRVGIALN